MAMWEAMGKPGGLGEKGGDGRHRLGGQRDTSHLGVGVTIGDTVETLCLQASQAGDRGQEGQLQRRN